MERSAVKACCDKEDLGALVLSESVRVGVQEFCLCPGARNSSFVAHLEKSPHLTTFTWPEERSAAFFALGRARRTKRPVAVITTSGTAVGELLPAVMEAYYTGVPLLLITADRPSRFRGTGAPQAAEQVDLFGPYTPFSLDISTTCDLSFWDKQSPAHVNVCLEDPLRPKTAFEHPSFTFEAFIEQSEELLVIVGTLSASERESVVDFLLKLNAAVYLEAPSGLREDSRLKHLQTDQPYISDSILRIGGIPTTKIWRDLTNTVVYNISALPFSGLDFTHQVRATLPTPIPVKTGKRITISPNFDREAALMHELSCHIPSDDLIYIGNSSPIRNWDLAATKEVPHPNIFASRGLNGIDGQLSTFLGLCEEDKHNWAIVGDLTLLYDLIAPWILQQQKVNISIVVINNSGGQIFSKMFPEKSFLNSHNLLFKPFADLWSLSYERWEEVPVYTPPTKSRLIELVP